MESLPLVRTNYCTRKPLCKVNWPSGQVDNAGDDDIGAQLGIAITSTNTVNGTWYYSTDNGSNWTVMGSVSDASARLLAADANTRIYFAPATNYNGSISDAITFRAWDRTSGTNGALADTTTNGGTTAFSTATDIAGLTLTSVNDAPVAVADAATATEAGGTSNGSAGTNPTGDVLTNDTDVDTGDTKTVTGVSAGVQALAVGPVATPVAGTYGSITIAANGSYTYTVDNSNAMVQALRTTANTLTDVFTYTLADAGGLTSTTQLTVTIQGANDTPTISSDGGTSTAAITLAENITAVTTVVGNDVDSGTTLNYSIIGGADAARFSINSLTGSLIFVTAPDFEMPTDVGGNNVYDVMIQVSDGSLATTQAIAVTIIDVSNFLVVTTTTDNNDSGIATGAAYDIEWLNAHKGADSEVSLREAIIAANNTTGTDTVNFGISGTGLKTISLTSALPSITDTIVIYGYSQAGASANTLAIGNNAVLNIELNGASAGIGANGLILAAGSSGSTIQGLAINGFASSGIQINGSDNNTVAGNFIGTNAAGTASVGNFYGIYVNNSSNTLIGGAAVAARNIVSGNIDDGIVITGVSSIGNTIQGNYVGTNAAGTSALANGGEGIYIGGALNTMIGGTSTGARNIISANGSDGIWITAAADATTVEGNYIGLGSDGVTALGNTGYSGIWLDAGASNTTIGGTSAGAGNVISSNQLDGITVGNGIGVLSNTTIQGNFIGTTADGLEARGNLRNGITLDNASLTLIGGLVSGAGNTIAYNAQDGVVVVGSNANGNSILRNAIFANNSLSIDLKNDGTTSNDGTKTSGEPNLLMDSPVISTANLVSNNLTLAGYIGSAANQSAFADARVEFYKITASSSLYLGFLTSDASGNYSGTLDVTGLGVNQSDTIVATATDLSGNTSEFSNVFQTNAPPIAISDTNTAVEAGGINNGTAGTSPTGNVLTNDTDVNIGDTKTVSGVAAGTVGSASGNVASNVSGTYGSITIAANGSYSYTVNNANASVQALRNTSQTLTDVFTYTMRDAGGLASTTQITITIQGANDAPVGVADNAAAIEASGNANATAGTSPTGNVLTNDTDVDSGDTKTVNGVASGIQSSTFGSVSSPVTGGYGSITIASDGTYTYTVDNSNAAVQALRTSGQSINDVFSYTVIDTAGLTSTTQITVTITGANDAPTAVADTTIAVEAGGTTNGTPGTSPIGNVLTNDTDPDSAANGETKTIAGVAAGTVGSASGSVATPVTGSYGSITISAGGAYSYAVDNSNSSVQALRTSSDTLTDVFTYTMTDADGLTSTSQITVTIQGANDAPVALNDAGTAVESGGTANGTAGSNATGNVLSNDTDVDTGDTKAVNGVVAGVQASAAGSVASSVTGTYGSVVIAADGSYTYTVDESNSIVQALRTIGQSITDVFSYSVIDTGGLTHVAQLTITIQGANDAPTPVSDTATAVEAGGANNATAGSNPTGNLLTNDTDVDSGDTKTVSGVAAGVQTSATGSVASNVIGNYGFITVAADGSYSYTVDNTNNAVQALRASGQTLTDVFTYTVTDTAGLTGTTQVTITIQGSNDTPTAVSDNAIADEAGGLNNATAGNDPAGNVLTNDADVDSSANGETKTVTGIAAGVQGSATGSVGSAVMGNHGSITIAADGSYAYSVDNSNAAVQSLRTTGQTLSDIFTYTMTDAGGLASSTQITVTIRGANDAPTSVADAASATEAGGAANASVGSNPTGNALTNDTDADSGDTKTVNGVAAGVQALAVGSVGSNVTGTYGSITIAADGSYTYTVDNTNSSVEALRTFSDTLTDTFSYTMIDTAGLVSTTQLVVTIHGQNDTLIANSDSFVALEAGGLYNATAGTTPNGNLLSNDTDVDASDTKTVIGIVAGAAGNANGSVGAAVVGSYGSILVASDGSYAYTVDNNNSAVQSLRNTSQTLTEVFAYTVRDTAGATSTATATVTIQGSNDTPIAVANTANAFEAGGISNSISGSDPTGNVLTNDTDPDSTTNGETKSVVGVAAGVQASAIGSVASSVGGSYGSIVIASDGTYTYTVDNTNLLVQALRASGQTLTDVFTYTMTDTAGATSTAQINVTVRGANDTPIAANDTAFAAEASGSANSVGGVNPTGNVLSNDADVDSVANGETKTVTGVATGIVASAVGSVGAGVVGNYGSVSISADGSYAYTVDNDNAAVQALRASGQTLNDVFTYTLTDAAGHSSSAQITVTIDGRNDAPIAQNDVGNATESGGLLNSSTGSNAFGNVLSNDQDVDSLANGETKTVVGAAAGSGASPGANAGTAVAGNYGSITLQSNGSYIYLINENDAAVQSLRLTGQTLNDIFTYRIVDAGGLQSVAEIVITIHGANDAPTAITDHGTAVEAGGLANASVGSNAAGNVLANDTDVDAPVNGETNAVIGVSAGVQVLAVANVGSTVTGSYGSIQIASNGTYSYVVDNTNASVQSLRSSSDTLEDVFTYSMTDALGLTSTTQITITIQGSNDSPYDLATTGLTVNENSANGISIGSVTRSDFDAGDTPSYSLVDSANGRFAINTNTGIVTVADSSRLDYEAAASHTIIVRVTDLAGGIYDETFTITLNDVNEFSVSVPSDSNAAANSIAENAVVGSSVGIIANASDLDRTTNGVRYTLLDDDGGRFAIDSNSGIVTVAGAINREADGAVRTIVVRATSDDGSTADVAFNINVTDVDEFNVGPITDIDTATNGVNENSASGTGVGMRLQAVDADATNSTIAYSLDNDASGRFRIDPITGIVTAVAALDFESVSSHSISVRATSTDGSFLTANFVIAVNNVNERPIAYSEHYTINSSTTLTVGGSGLLVNDTDPEFDGLRSVLVTGPAMGTLNLLSDGSFAYTPVVSYVGDVTFQYMANDGSLNSVVQTVTITVTLPAAPAGGGGSSSGGSSSGSSTNSDSGTAEPDPTDSTDKNLTVAVVPVVGAIDSSHFNSRSHENINNTNEPSSSSSDEDASRSSALTLNFDFQALGIMNLADQNSLLSSTVFLSDSHSAVDRMNAEQDARLVQSLAVNVSVLSHLQEDARENSYVAAIEGAKFIAKTAIGSGVLVWVLHVSQVVAALLAASSAWMHIDPLSVLNASKDLPDGKATDVAEALFDNDTTKK